MLTYESSILKVCFIVFAVKVKSEFAYSVKVMQKFCRYSQPDGFFPWNGLSKEFTLSGLVEGHPRR